jgi:hypothetical protein
MQIQTIQFTACRPTSWTGRYARIPGDTAVYHLNYRDGKWWPVIYWDTDEDRLTCAAVDCPASQELGEAVAHAKWELSKTEGGSFLINEFGQVIVPSARGDGQRMLAGVINGNLLFENPLEEGLIDLSDTSSLQPGDPWKLPYVGMMYRFSNQGEIYFWHQQGDDRRRINPIRQDTILASALRQVRGAGCRFIVNHAGVVLTKEESAEAEYWPLYIGRIDKSFWFKDEAV